MHQGESDNGDQNWPRNVKLVYDRLLEELGLKEENVPLLVGELVSIEQGGLCYQHNICIPSHLEHDLMICESFLRVLILLNYSSLL